MLVWERLTLSDGTLARLVTSVAQLTNNLFVGPTQARLPNGRPH